MPMNMLKSEKKTKNAMILSRPGRKNPATAIISTCTRMSEPMSTAFLLTRG